MTTHATTPPIETAPLMLSVSGCRGIVGESLTPDRIINYAASIAHYLIQRSGDPSPTVVIGRDGRASGDMVQRLAVGALLAAGCRVIDLGVATTPTVGVMVRHHSAAGGVVITASHNPQPWNGIKTITNLGAAPPKAEADAIIARYHASNPQWRTHEGVGRFELDDTAAHVHVAKVLSAIEAIHPIDAIRGQGFRVVVDSVNASGARAAKLLCDALGCDLLHLSADDSGIFPHTPEPTAENLSQLAKAATTHAPSVIFAQDPDADRLAILDSEGRYIGEEYTLVLCAWALLESLGDAAQGMQLATNLSTSRMLDDLAEKFGCTVIRTAVGEAHLAALLQRDNNLLLLGEGNGGAIWPAVVPIRDSIGAMALTLALMAKTGKSLSQLVEEIPNYAIVKRKAPIREGLAQAAMDAARECFPDATVSDIDGVRLDITTEDGPAWIHVRPSNTEPILRLIAEAPTQSRADAIVDAVEAAIAQRSPA